MTVCPSGTQPQSRGFEAFAKMDAQAMVVFLAFIEPPEFNVNGDLLSLRKYNTHDMVNCRGHAGPTTDQERCSLTDFELCYAHKRATSAV